MVSNDESGCARHVQLAGGELMARHCHLLVRMGFSADANGRCSEHEEWKGRALTGRDNLPLSSVLHLWMVPIWNVTCALRLMDEEWIATAQSAFVICAWPLVSC